MLNSTTDWLLETVAKAMAEVVRRRLSDPQRLFVTAANL